MASYSRYAGPRTRGAHLGRLCSTIFYSAAGIGVAFALMSFLIGIAASLPDWGEEQRGELVAFMATIAAVALLVPALNGDLDRTTRFFARSCCVSVVVLAVLHGTGAFDPMTPLQAIVDHVILPLRQRYNV